LVYIDNIDTSFEEIKKRRERKRSGHRYLDSSEAGSRQCISLSPKPHLVFGRDELVPRLARVAADERLEVRVQLDAVLLQVPVQLVRAQDLCDLDQLVVVVVPVEKGLL
jgi:hypothetical protein